MTRVAETIQSTDGDVTDEAALALAAESRARHGVPDPEEGFGGPLLRPMATGEFADFVEEVAVHVSLALVYVGLDAKFEAVHDATDFDPDGNDYLPRSLNETERSISFRDEDGTDLPVYVSCGSDGVMLVCVGRTDEATGEMDILFVSPPRTFSEMDLLVEDVVRAIDSEVPRPTFH